MSDSRAADVAVPGEAPDRLEALRAELETVHELPVADRAEFFERANAAVVAELGRLEEV